MPFVHQSWCTGALHQSWCIDALEVIFRWPLDVINKKGTREPIALNTFLIRALLDGS